MRQLNWTLIVMFATAAMIILAASRNLLANDGGFRTRQIGLGCPITDRATWNAIGATNAYAQVLAEAQRLIDTPPADIPDDLYLDFFRTGNRMRYQVAELERRARLKNLVIAECIENQGRFLPGIEQVIEAICAARSWVLPAHDKNQVVFRGEGIIIDLVSSAVACELATADWLLGDKLSAQTRQLMRDNIRRRVLDPFLESAAKDGQGAAYWLNRTNNWNPVCLAYVTGAAMEQVSSPDERARFLSAVMKYSPKYISGFGLDGYCTEGLHYWNYGMQHYIILVEVVRLATDGAVDLLADPRMAQIARFPLKMHIMNGVYPAFADCQLGVAPDHNLMYYINRRWGLGLAQYNHASTKGRLVETAAHAMRPEALSPAILTAKPAAQGIRDWFDKSGILISRPAVGSTCQLAVALKGGHNAEAHNHNDLGSFVVVTGDKAVLHDMGLEEYTARTFSDQRYDSKLINSFGHAVPVVAGRLQRTGPEARAEIIKAQFDQQTDTLTMQLRSAYDVADLQELKRTFVYSRQGEGSLTVTDEVAFASPQTFEIALIASGTCTQMDDGSLVLQTDGEALRATIESGGEKLKIEMEQICDNDRFKGLRVGIRLLAPVTSARISVTLTPASARRHPGSTL